MIKKKREKDARELALICGLDSPIGCPVPTLCFLDGIFRAYFRNVLSLFQLPAVV